MVTLKKLLGARSEVHYECMYTKHKTQKRKVWHDGFVSLSATHKLVLFEEMPPEGRVLDEAKMSQYDWERRDEEFIQVPKFLIEILNDTPLDICGVSAATLEAAPSPFETQAPRVVGSKFRTPVASGSEPPQQMPRPGGARQPLGRPSAKPPQQPPQPPPVANTFDFDRNPTSEWSYTPNATSRSGRTTSVSA
ncbi:hypothetical protein PybrP1_013004 [[Pythium] brassicae (nom. inval.)]|nr:hypothetical protein PybrP1_013004 [[Pythium] brassicae (nom. inval.)]